MKKTIISMLTVFCVLLVAAAAYALSGDQIVEGKVLIQKSQLLIEKGEMMKAFTDQDKVWMVDQGHQMLKEGMDIIEKGEMMYTEEGKSNTQQVGAALRSGGNLLLKMGRKKDPLTDKDKEKIVKEGSTMTEIGKLMLEKGKVMAPQTKP